MDQIPNTFRSGPDERGHFGDFGGRFVAETLMPLILELEHAYNDAKADPNFRAELDALNKHYTGRPSPLYFAERLTEHLGGAKIYFKRDELNHTGSHKINNCLGQIQLARRMGKTRIIAETGAGQHGVAVATVAARFGLPCVIYMGATDIERQRPNVSSTLATQSRSASFIASFSVPAPEVTGRTSAPSSFMRKTLGR
jgi:tryptophan synthase beta chain